MLQHSINTKASSLPAVALRQFKHIKVHFHCKLTVFPLNPFRSLKNTRVFSWLLTQAASAFSYYLWNYSLSSFPFVALSTAKTTHGAHSPGNQKGLGPVLPTPPHTLGSAWWPAPRRIMHIAALGGRKTKYFISSSMESLILRLSTSKASHPQITCVCRLGKVYVSDNRLLATPGYLGCWQLTCLSFHCQPFPPQDLTPEDAHSLGRKPLRRQETLAIFNTECKECCIQHSNQRQERARTTHLHLGHDQVQQRLSPVRRIIWHNTRKSPCTCPRRAQRRCGRGGPAPFAGRSSPQPPAAGNPRLDRKSVV